MGRIGAVRGRYWPIGVNKQCLSKGGPSISRVSAPDGSGSKRRARRGEKIARKSFPGWLVRVLLGRKRLPGKDCPEKFSGGGGCNILHRERRE